MKLVDSIHEPQKGELRVILASEGEPNTIIGKETLLKLNFNGVQTGEALVDIVSGRVADGITSEYELTPQQCGQATITIEGITDVNYSGEFTLLDLGINARHLFKSPSEPELSNYNTDIVIDGIIDENDLIEIARYMMQNPDYEMNK